MNDLLAGLGFAVVFEGLLWALAPNVARRMVQQMAETADSRLQGVALLAVAFGVLLVWVARG
jgi:uncharacterized protein